MKKDNALYGNKMMNFLTNNEIKLKCLIKWNLMVQMGI